MKKYLLYLIIISILIPSLASAQERNSQLAYRYFRDKEYEAAASIFNELYQTAKSKSYFTYYITCLLRIEKFSEAEKSVKREIRRHPGDLVFQVELGHIYKVSGKIEKANKQFSKTIDNISPNKREYITVANALRSKGEHDLAIKTYEKGRVAIKQTQLFHFEIANILMSQRNYDKMLDEYLLTLSITPDKLQQVQNQLQSALYRDINSDLDTKLKSKLIQQVQNSKNNLVYTELLLWYYIQKKQFDLAFTLAQSIDLIKKNGGEKLYRLAQIANNNKNYLIAENCYQHIVEKGIKSKFYQPALMGVLENKHLLLENQRNTSAEEWHKLSEGYLNYFANLKQSNKSIPALIRFSNLRAFKLNEIEKAKKQLQAALNIRNLNRTDRAKIKLELADINLLQDKKWDAVLLYSQIEKTNKNNPIGYKAKLKKAKVSYFLGDMDWAKAQLNVLKASTSKLIANDALDLAQLISDNTTLDSTYSAMKYYAEADFLIFQGKTDSAQIKLQQFFKTFPGHSLSDEVQYQLYKLNYSQGFLAKAIANLTYIIKEHPYENLAAKALFKQAELFEIQGKEKDYELNYKKLILEYPESIYSVKARERFATIRNSKQP